MNKEKYSKLEIDYGKIRYNTQKVHIEEEIKENGHNYQSYIFSDV